MLLAGTGMLTCLSARVTKPLLPDAGHNNLCDPTQRSVHRECRRCLQWQVQGAILNDMSAIDSVATAMACRAWG